MRPAIRRAGCNECGGKRHQGGHSARTQPGLPGTSAKPPIEGREPSARSAPRAKLVVRPAPLTRTPRARAAGRVEVRDLQCGARLVRPGGSWGALPGRKGYAGACPVTQQGCRGEMRRALRRPARTGGLQASRTSAGADGPPLGPHGASDGVSVPAPSDVPSRSRGPRPRTTVGSASTLPCVGGDLWHLVRASRRDTGWRTPAGGRRPVAPGREVSAPGAPPGVRLRRGRGYGELRLQRLRVGERHVSQAAPGCGGAPAPSP
jgi:hypothetical protein